MISLGAVLDVAIGLALTYALLALIAAAFQEAVAGVMKKRARDLEAGLKELLAGKNPEAPALKLFGDVFNHAAVKSISPGGRPSYVAARSFSLALFDTLGGGSQSPLFSQIERNVAALPDGCPAKTTLLALIRQTGGDIDRLRASVETWFDDAMDRLSGGYKRFSGYFALGFGLAVAIAFNVNTFTIARTLWTDPDKRAVLVAVATNMAHDAAGAAAPAACKKVPPAAGTPAEANAPAAQSDLQARYAAASECLDALPIPIGWDESTADSLRGAGWVLAIFGWLATALAVSLGAPFWFDTLQSLINIRAAGPKPARADERGAVNAN